MYDPSHLSPPALRLQLVGAARGARNCVPFKLNSRERPSPPLPDALACPASVPRARDGWRCMCGLFCMYVCERTALCDACSQAVYTRKRPRYSSVCTIRARGSTPGENYPGLLLRYRSMRKLPDTVVTLYGSYPGSVFLLRTLT